MDERLPEHGPEALRLYGHARLRRGAPVPGVLAARSVRGAAAGHRGGQTGPAQAHRRTGERATRRDPALLLPGRDQRRSARGDARVRHPPDEPAAAAAADPGDAGEPAPATWRERAPGRA